jgi:hypothetical protein
LQLRDIIGNTTVAAMELDLHRIGDHLSRLEKRFAEFMEREK